ANAKRLKEVDSWDTPVWLDEVYDLTRRIRDVNKLRVTHLNAEPLAQTAKSRYAAKVFIKGTLLDRRNPRQPLDDLISQFTREGYSPSAPKVEGNNQFSLTVSVARRSPNEHDRAIDLEAQKKAAAASRAAFGKMGGGEDAEDGKGWGAKAKGKGRGKR